MKLRPLLRRAQSLLHCSLVTLLPCYLVTLSPSLSAQVGKVGINTTTPAAMLHVMDSSVLFTGPATLPATPAPPPVSGPGTRMMWYPDKAAFRAGQAPGTQWDQDSIGDFSMAFGWMVKAKGDYSFVGGGVANNATSVTSFVGGGSNNKATDQDAAVIGGFANSCSGGRSFVGGGTSNTISNGNSCVGGGTSNTISSANAFVGGGTFNTVSGSRSFIGGGENNAASMNRSFVGGGSGNLAGAENAFVGGGSVNFAGALNSFAGGGTDNVASGQRAFVGGGDTNEASGPNAFVGGGDANVASGNDAFSGGGTLNTASGSRSFAGGGSSNTGSGFQSFVGGGFENTASGPRSFVAGGSDNDASGNNSFIGGGIGLYARSFCEANFGHFSTDYTPASLNSINANDRLFVIGNGTSLSDRSNAVTVLKNGRMGIGTDTPDLLMEIRGPESAINGASLALGGTGSDQTEAGRIRFLDGTASTNWRGMYMHHDGANNKFHIGVHTANTNVATDDIPIITIERGDNQVGIGTTTPGFLLEVDGSAGKPGGGLWSASSDARLKTDVSPYTDGLNSVLAIDPVTYRYNDLSGYATEPTHIGVIAQELQEVAPYMVSVSGRVAADGSTGYLAVDNSGMIYMLINAVKEQQAIIEAQQADISELKRLIGITGQGNQQDEELAAIKAELANLKALIVGQPAPAGTTAQAAN